MSILDDINKNHNLKDKSINQLNVLAKEIRLFMVENVSRTGGHLASSLGTVELTIAIHKVFDTSFDKLVWDVGHQAYAHKILTGRMDEFSTLRQFGGISGFPKREESIHDHFNTGHSSTSVSAALGMARARDLQGKDNSVIAVIGDGALTGGMAFEALNDAGAFNGRLIVILNDNNMSISQNVGALSNYFNHIRTKTSYERVKAAAQSGLKKIPVVGNKLISAVRKIKNSIKYTVMPSSYFETLGFDYYGPIDGHDIGRLVEMLTYAKQLKRPVILHTITTKGKGYRFAEKHPLSYHGVSKFDINKQYIPEKNSELDFSCKMGQILTLMANENPKITAFTAAMPNGCGLTGFKKAHPKRFFDVGIAEQHAVTCAAGMACEGFVPVVAVYSTFLQRAYDQILHDVALQYLHVVLMVDRGGTVGQDGETHQGIYDLSYLRSIPNIKIIAPADFYDLKLAMEYAINGQNGPIAIRYPKGCEAKGITHNKSKEIWLSEIITEGSDVTIAAAGKMVENSLKASELLKEKGITCEVINIRSIKPVDFKTIKASAEKTKKLVTVEDNTLPGGIGEAIAKEFSNLPVEILCIGYDDAIVKQGKVNEVYKFYGLDGEGIAKKISEAFLWQKNED